MYDSIGEAAVRIGVRYLRRRYRRQIRIGAAIAAGIVAVAVFLATRNVREG
jgi:ABC-type lipoprotein release transport system permease subunit